MTSGVQQTFQKALALHQRGDLARAQALYKDVLMRDGRHFDSLHLLGLTYVQKGQPETGVDYIARALGVRSDFPEAHYNMGNALLSLQRPGEALENFDRAIRLNARDPQYHFERGNALKDLGRAEEALAAYDAALRLFPGYAEAHNNRGIALKDTGQLDAALASYDKALALRPDYAEAHGNRGNVLKEMGRLEDAMASYDRAVRLKPDHAEAYSNRGNALAQLKLLDEALASHDRAIALKPDYAEGYNNRGIVLKDLGRAEEALASYDMAIALRPRYAEAYSNRGNALKEMKRMDEALASFGTAIGLQPDFAEAHVNRGNALKDLGRDDEALADYQTASRLKPSSAMARYNESLIHLQHHRFREGFDLYRWRWEGDGSGWTGPRTEIPRWDGAVTTGEILLWAEQGVGDEVFFSSLLSLLDRDALKIALSADLRLHPMLARSFPGLRLIDSAATRLSITGDFVAQAPIGDIGHILKADAGVLSRRRYPYLSTSAERRRQVKAMMAVPQGHLLCGLSWRSGNKKVGAERSLALADLAPVLAVPDVTFVNLQYGDVSAEIDSVRERFGIEIVCPRDLDVFADIDGLLALIDLCDMVVTIDNLTAHLAGAIGKPAAVFIPRGGAQHWYWGGEDESFWYPSLRLLHQETAGDWTRSIDDAASLLGQVRPGPMR
jgi:tetratricopeptide (TPR) repeat protein